MFYGSEYSYRIFFSIVIVWFVKMNTISGKTEFDIFKNYYTAEKSNSCRSTVNLLPLQSKDDVLSERLRLFAKTDFAQGKYYVCLEKYTKSLRYATFNGREYAMALANRSATHFAMKMYKHCLIDINLCLQAAYPINLQPKMLIRKAKCFIKMGNFQQMMETINDCYKQIQDNSNLSTLEKDRYMQEVKSVMEVTKIDLEELPFEEISLPRELIQEENQLNPNVSASIKIKFNRNADTDYVAARDIPCGEVLFVDTAYSVGFTTDIRNKSEDNGFFFCDYCWNEAKNSIPCKICVTLLYCSKNCRDDSWSEYHQWECDMLRSQSITGDCCIALRTVIKAVRSDVIFQISTKTKPFTPYKGMDPYLYIYRLDPNLKNYRLEFTKMFIQCCEKAVLMVEFLKKTNFFTYLLSTSSCQKDYPALVIFIGGLLFRHNIQIFKRMLAVNCASSIVSVNEKQGELELLFVRIMQFCAFCPTVSELKYSCQSNTSTYFNGRTCIVKACQNIKAGDNIFRSDYNCTPSVPFLLRKKLLLSVNYVNCNCAACENSNENIDALDTCLCTECGRFTGNHFVLSNFMKCSYCKRITFTNDIDSIIEHALIYKFESENVDVTQYLNEMVAGTKTLKTLVNPNHIYMYDAYKKLLLLYSKRENINEFKEALLNFKTCAKNRNGRFNAYNYVIDLSVICRACFAYLHLNKSMLQKRESMEMLTYFSDVVKEAKEIAKFTFPPLLRLFAPIESYILKFVITHVSLQD